MREANRSLARHRNPLAVIPAQAGIQAEKLYRFGVPRKQLCLPAWVPAVAGMTGLCSFLPLPQRQQ